MDGEPDAQQSESPQAFTERRWHWWLRVLAIPATLAIVAAAVAVYTNSNKSPNGQHNSQVVGSSACLQFCGIQVGRQAPQPPQSTDPENPNLGCTDDRDSDTEVAGWGPARNLLAPDKYSEFPSFNLDATDEYGDERGLYGIRDSAAPDSSPFEFQIKVERGKTYRLRIYIHNSASESNADVAKGTRVLVRLPTCTGRRILSNGFITSTDAEPGEVYGGVTMLSDELFNLAYIDGTARLCNNHFTCRPAEGKNGAPISDDFLTKQGALIGFDALDGDVRGGYQYSSYFSFEVRPQFAAQ